MSYTLLAEEIQTTVMKIAKPFTDADDYLASALYGGLDNLVERIRELARLDGHLKCSVTKRFELLKQNAERFGAPYELIKLPYNEFLKTEYWQIIRAFKLYKANYKCQLCRAKAEMHVHHSTYKYHGEELTYWATHLIVLCKNCHAKHHDKLAGGVK